ncbi:2TM domain-containing protein [Candidatus Odyssella thessalonicensis]|uniref:2TM domain-containing protein n=1 Tax=Candidatus Odyssella thessalonicensis TaxID=84647 RepID=UPI000225ACBC|nr:2TM domain-containing protein [Candidatus Odyssella thessalonicensis]
MFESEDNIRERIRELKEYYTNLIIYGVVIFACLIIWLTTGGAFWPIWVMVALGSVALLKGIRLGLFPKMSELFPFLRPDWEEVQIKAALEEKERIQQEKKGE